MSYTTSLTDCIHHTLMSGYQKFNIVDLNIRQTLKSAAQKNAIEIHKVLRKQHITAYQFTFAQLAIIAIYAEIYAKVQELGPNTPLSQNLILYLQSTDDAYLSLLKKLQQLSVPIEELPIPNTFTRLPYKGNLFEAL